MRKSTSNYPQLEEHVQQHGIFIEKTKEALLFKTTDKTVGDLATFLEDWFLHHINDVDRRAINYAGQTKHSTSKT